MNEITHIDEELKRLAEDFDIRSNEFRQVCEDAERKRHIYDLAKAGAMLKAPPEFKVDEKRAYVVQACQQQALEAHLAEATREWYKERLRALAGLLTATQSRARLVGEDIKLTNSRY